MIIIVDKILRQAVVLYPNRHKMIMCGVDTDTLKIIKGV